MAAGRAWVAGDLFDRPTGSGASRGDDALADARALGLSAEAEAAIEAALAYRPGIMPGGGAFAGLYPDHAPAGEAFLAAATQWRVADGHYVGLDYAGAAVAWRACGIEPNATTFARLQAIECAARDALNARAS